MRACGIAALIVALTLVVGCNSVPLKERATRVMQAAHTVVGNAQDAEISLYAAGVSQITEADHKAFHGALVQFFDAEITLADALKAWRAGEPAPKTVKDAIGVAHRALTEAKRIAPASLKGVVDILGTAVTQVWNLIVLLDGSPLPASLSKQLDQFAATYAGKGL